MTHRYTVEVERELDGGYHASCPALPGCHTQGESLQEAIVNMQEAARLYIESLVAHNEPVPADDVVKQVGRNYSPDVSNLPAVRGLHRSLKRFVSIFLRALRVLRGE